MPRHAVSLPVMSGHKAPPTFQAKAVEVVFIKCPIYQSLLSGESK
jgi:hypothetical protein